MNIIEHDPNIHRDTNNTYYNDIKHYVTITITSGSEINEYTFRYYGPDEQWKTEEASCIFICYAYDKNRNGGSEGNGGVTWRTPRLKKNLTSVFEKEFVSKVDKELRMNHTEE